MWHALGKQHKQWVEMLLVHGALATAADQPEAVISCPEEAWAGRHRLKPHLAHLLLVSLPLDTLAALAALHDILPPLAAWLQQQHQL